MIKWQWRQQPQLPNLWECSFHNILSTDYMSGVFFILMVSSGFCINHQYSLSTDPSKQSPWEYRHTQFQNQLILKCFRMCFLKIATKINFVIIGSVIPFISSMLSGSVFQLELWSSNTASVILKYSVLAVLGYEINKAILYND